MNLPRIFVSVPGVEDLDAVVVLLRAAGAVITDQRREFVVDGPLTPERASAVWVLAQHRDANSEGSQLRLRIEPDTELEPALTALCPQGFERISGEYLDPDSGYSRWIAHQHDGDSSIDWWAQQQRRQSELRKAPATAAPRVPTEPVCCGEGWTGAPTAGAPSVPGCMLCPKSAMYWRTHRADGRPYEPVKPLGG